MSLAAGHDFQLQPSAWVQRWASLIPARGRVLDVACGNGRHSRLLAAEGLEVWAVDRDAQALASLAAIPGIRTLHADLENAPWPLGDTRFDGIVVTNYLHRPLFPLLLDALSDAGVLIYETFAAGNEQFGKPSNPAFLLRPGELLEVVRDRLRVVAFEDWCSATPKPAMIQRLVACGRELRCQPGAMAGTQSG
jgi:SAM-dependent methyltransferase